MAMPKSVCDNCVNAECIWRAPTGGNDPPVVVCPHKIEKPQTNADRIRSMTDEELAQFLSNLSANGCDYAKCPARHGCEAFSVKTCKEQMENWLKQEVDKQ